MPRPVEVYRFAGRQRTKIAAGMASGSVATAPFLGGRVDQAVGILGAAAFCYTAVRVIKHARRLEGQNETNNKKVKGQRRRFIVR